MRMMRRKPHSRPYKKGKVTTILTNTVYKELISDIAEDGKSL